MHYKIIAVHALYKEEKIVELSVLWEANQDGELKATCLSKMKTAGYESLRGDEDISDKLLQRAAGYGFILPDALRKKYFGK